MADHEATGRTPEAEILAEVPAVRGRETRARRRGRRAASARHDADAGRIALELTNGYSFAFPVASVPALAGATPEQLAAVELSSAGSGLHWEALDVDLSVAGLLLAALSRP